MKKESLQGGAGAELSHGVSPALVKRLPRYFRYLRELIRQGRLRISSGELSELMQVTASQIRQDLNCFGGFGQQGYGYNINHLYAKICEILGVGEGYNAVVIGAGNLGRALVRSPMFEKRGVNILGMFDVDSTQVGRAIGDTTVYPMEEIREFCRTYPVDIAVLTLPKQAAEEVAQCLYEAGIRGFWNFTGNELELPPDAVAENVHIGDSLMTLCFELRRMEMQEDGEENT